jgi:hypothetical protein
MMRFGIELFSAVAVSIVAGIVLRHLRFSQRLAFAGGATLTALALVAIIWLANRQPPAIETILSQPTDGTEVERRTTVRGKSSPLPEAVYVLVHPRATDVWWVQSLPLLQQDGNWNVDVNLGEGSVGIGETFDIIALATNEGWVLRNLRDVNLRPAEQFSTTTPALARSNIITVKRSR